MVNIIPEKHESYGALQFCRHQRPATALFGSSIKHDNTIRLRISAAEMRREHNNDYMYSSHSRNDIYVEVEMSYTQFAEAITSLNQGVGVPVTIRFADGREMASCPFTSKDEQFRSEFLTDLEGLTETAAGALALAKELFVSKKPMTKAEKEELLSKLESVLRVVKSDIPFVRDSFAEQMNKTVTEAKGNFEGFVQNRINDIANEAIVQNIRALSNTGNTAALLGFEGNTDGNAIETAAPAAERSDGYTSVINAIQSGKEKQRHQPKTAHDKNNGTNEL